MKLMEFFGRNIEIKKKENKQDDKNISDELFWFILDHDRLHKDFFHPTAKKIKQAHQENRDNKEQGIQEFMPMVNKGCLEFYHRKKMTGKVNSLFPKELRKEMCERLYDHYHDDIVKDQYRLGQ